ncbi:MAG: DUF262 domain-containing protein [Spirochaetia bacterium]|nr:DUF262 domain-containing protein [Spirochaetia bacterium]
MHGEAKLLLKFLDGSDNRYIIPVYQRNYDWKPKQCEQLFNDLVQIIKKDRKSHFFGSIVTSSANKGGKSDYLVIDGQQRITTISILFTAMVNLMKSGLVEADDKRLAEKIEKKFLIDEYQTEERKLRLKPIKDDCISFDKLITNNPSEFVESSNITQNYHYFENRIKNIKRDEISIDELYEAIFRLEIIDIFLDKEDNPQLIFESLNSTGLDLTEADKIRNFILMGLDAKKQEEYYESYWNKIEKFTAYNVSGFIRNYLTLIQKKIPNINNVYFTFKEYVLEKMNIESAEDCEAILKDMLYYSQIYNRIISAKTDPKDVVSSILCRLNNIEMTVSYPFLLAMFGHEQRSEITFTDVETTLKVLESYICRRIMCPNYASNALNKVFCNLDSEVMKLKSENPKESYSSLLIYYLLSRNGAAGFPTDKDFVEALTNRDVYHMFKKNREYLFDRLENGDTVERVNVIELMENGDLTIEHIMPQTLTEEWKKELGPDYQNIYDLNLHTLKNLTLTGYNSKYSNSTYTEKKNCEKGFKDSGLNLNKPLLDYEHWTIAEMNNRLEKLLTQSEQLWPYPKTDFVPAKKENESVTLDDDEVLTGRTLVSYSYGTVTEREVYSWVEMFTDVIKQIYDEDSSQIRILAADESYEYIVLSNTEKQGDWFKIDEDVYLYTHNSTNAKMRILNRVFEAYGKDKSELVFNLKADE